MQRWVMHVDMDAFYASIEQRDHPAYRGLPVIVGGTGKRGVVATASYEARRFGVHSALSSEEARRRCPQGIFVPGNHALYRQVSQQIFHILEAFSPLIEPLALDEAFMDVSGMERLIGDWRDYGRSLKARILKETGLVASVGIAPNKFLAKLASDMEKPDGLVFIAPGTEKDVLRDLPLRALWGVGGKSAAKLAQMGFGTLGQIAAADPQVLSKTFGKAAYQFVALANGHDERPVEADRKAQSIGNEMTFEEDLREREAVMKILLQLAEKVGWRLRLAGLAAQTVTLKVRWASFVTVTRSRTLPEATNFDEEIYRTAQALFAQTGAMQGVRLLGVTCAHLSSLSQGSLFQEDEKKKALYGAVDRLRLQFGAKAVTRAGLLHVKEDEKR